MTSPELPTAAKAAQDRVGGIIAGARKALGGEDKIAGLKTPDR